MEYNFVNKIFRVKYGKTWLLTQRLGFDHKNKTVFIRGIWIDTKKKSNKYKALIRPEGEQNIPIPEF